MDALWEHQLLGLAKLRASAKAGRRRIVLGAPCGSGKTEVGVEVVKGARAKGNSVAFCVPMLNLIDQTVKRFVKRGIDAEEMGVIQARHPLTKEGAPIQVCSVQTLDRREILPDVQVALIDEAHIQFKVIQRWMNERPGTLFVGMSATPWAKGMADDWQELITISSIPAMIEAGVLAPYLAYAPPLQPDLTGIPDNRITKDYAEGPLSERMQEKKLVADVVSTWLDKGEGRPTLVFCVDRAHAAAINDQFEDAGVRARYIDANTPTDERADYMDGLESGETQVITSIGTMTTGTDLPVVSCISYVRPTKSPILYVQSICRGLRSYAGKQNCLILDHSTSSHRLLSWLGEVDHPLLPGKVEKKSVSHETDLPLPRICSACNFFIPAKTPHCPNCGFVPKRQTPIQNEAGELVAFTGAKLSDPQKKANKDFSSDEKRRFYGELKGYAAFKHYNPKWADNKYKARFGVWPNAYKEARPLWPPSRETASWIRGQVQYWAITRQGGLRHAR
jgi:DNA repair protein RadD